MSPMGSTLNPKPVGFGCCPGGGVYGLEIRVSGLAQLALHQRKRAQAPSSILPCCGLHDGDGLHLHMSHNLNSLKGVI